MQRCELPASLSGAQPARALVVRRRRERILRDLPIGAEPQTAVGIPFVARQSEELLGLRRIPLAVDAGIRPERGSGAVCGPTVPGATVFRRARREQESEKHDLTVVPEADAPWKAHRYELSRT
jgi:hypothetical protein